MDTHIGRSDARNKNSGIGRSLGAVAVLLVLWAVLWTPSAFVAVPSAQQRADMPGRLVAIADIHGELDNLIAILRRTGLIDERRQWTGGKTTLVQTGDYTDRGANVREVMDLLMSLERQASAAGGRMIVLLGNHEIMNLMGAMQDVTPTILGTFADEGSEARRQAAYDAHVKLIADRTGPNVANIFKPPVREAWMAAHPPGFIEYREAFRPQGVYGKWLRSKAVVTMQGDTIFMHAGISPQRAPGKLEDVNTSVRDEIKQFDEIVTTMLNRKLILPFFTLEEIILSAKVEHDLLQNTIARETSAGSLPDMSALSLLRQLEKFLTLDSWDLVHADGPMWFRGYAMWTGDEGGPQMRQLLAKYRVKHFAVGHTIPSTKEITPRFSTSVFLMDTGMLASHYKGQPSALEIQNGTFKAIYLDKEVVLVNGK